MHGIRLPIAAAPINIAARTAGSLVAYAFSKIFWAIAQPSTALLLLCIAGALICLWRPLSVWGRGLLTAGVAGFAACAFLPIGAWLMWPLEDRFPPPSPMPAHVDGIIVLGGAIDRAESAARGHPALNGHAERMTAFVSLARRYPQARLLFTGGNPDLHPSGPTEADVARVLFAGLGLDMHRVVFEERSRNTRENALLSKRLVSPQPGQTWLLVTSAADMPRAVGCFRAVGWAVIAYPVDYRTRQGSLGSTLGLVAGLRDVDWAAHEWIGLIYYRMRNWTSSQFPDPNAAEERQNSHQLTG
jgi:uncharacterized SAM-binding protein YcdF (DUF218 family)